MFRSSVAVVVALGIGAALIPPSSAAAGHRHRGYSGFRGGYYPSFHLGYAPGYYPSFGVGFGPYPVSVGFSFWGGPRDPRGSLRFEVHPKNAEVYIDGYYAGIVDDFGKLRLEPGAHDVTLYLDGYRIFEETVYSTTGSTVKIHHEMEPLAEGELAPPRPAVPGARARPAPAAPAAPPALPPPASSGPTSTPLPAASFGVLALRTQPAGAELVIDGEPWLVPEGSERLMLHLPAGRYEIELRKDGYAPFLTSVEVSSAETTAVNVLLGPAP